MSLGVPTMGCENPFSKRQQVLFFMARQLRRFLYRRRKIKLLTFGSGGFAEYQIRDTILANCSQPPDHL